MSGDRSPPGPLLYECGLNVMNTWHVCMVTERYLGQMFDYTVRTVISSLLAIAAAVLFLFTVAWHPSLEMVPVMACGVVVSLAAARVAVDWVPAFVGAFVLCSSILIALFACGPGLVCGAGVADVWSG